MASILDFLLIAAASTLFVAIIYHWVVAGCWRRHHGGGGGPQQQPTMTSGQGETPDSAENWMVELIPTHKHQKGMGLAGEDGKCAVCLCEFEDGEELRTLPQCMHTYHAYCIDMWLYSHSSCPICRANATRSSYIYRRFSGSDIA